METILEFWQFIKKRKKYWLIPLFISLIMIGLLSTLTQGTAIAPFLYTLF